MLVEVFIEGQKLDLFEDEGITVKSVTQDLKDISKLFTDYSQSFNIPASKNNNLILSNWFNADILNGFDARTRLQATITINTLDFKLGKIRLDGADIENNVPKTYKLTFFGNAIKIKDLLGEDKLSSLTWLDNFDHAYSGSVVKDGLINGLDTTVDSITYESAVIYPLISYQRQWFYNSDTLVDTDTDVLCNIAYDSGSGRGVNSKYLKPAIKLHLVIQAITEKYGLNFNSPFFDLETFKGIYINLNKSIESLSTGLDVIETVTGAFVPDGIIISCEYITTITPLSGFEDVPYKIKLTVNGQVYHETSQFITGTNTRGTGDEVTYNGEYELIAEVITEESFEFNATTTFRVYSWDGSFDTDTVFTNNYSSQSISLNSVIANELPDMKVYDFLVNIFKTFNLIATADGDDIYVQDLQSWYSEGQIYDVTKFINLKEEEQTRGKIYKDISFTFEDTEQILGEQFKLSNNQGYGNLIFKLTNSDGNDLQDVDGETLAIESIFENPIFERLFNLNDNSETTFQYCPYFSREIKPISGGIFMFYGKQQSVSSNSIGFLNDGTLEEINTKCYMPSHSYVLDQSSFNLNFNAEINEYTSIVMPNTIYKSFYDDYIVDMFSVKRRMYNFEALFPDYFLNQLKLNDRLIIKDRRYIINSITSNLTDRKDTLELINDIYDAPLASDTLNTSLFTSPFNIYSGNAESYNARYIGLSGKAISQEDLGDGTAFINNIKKNTTGVVDNISFDLLENTTSSERTVGIKVTDGINNPIFYINQKSNALTSSITFDNTSVTFDSNIITFDNG